jgi:histidinol-phosphate phosphatase family protein
VRRWAELADGGPLVFLPERPVRVPPGARAAFLDRDGTLNEGVPDPSSGLPESPLAPADVRLIPGAAAAVGELAAAGYLPVCVSNQPAAAKRKITIAELQAVHERVLALLAAQGVHLAASFLCPHHPRGLAPQLSVPCDCRKPAPGMLRQAAACLALELEGSWMFGDTDADILAGRATGCRTVLIEYAGSAHKRAGAVDADVLATSLADGVTQVLARAAH